ncbi:MAG: Lrp/AsnC family transcriptional regulator [Candidatus Vecturithrix sp.]|nr:Lrp/AsnC family transcriptional regulator [Candidatus Vecturithrix sp.]
MDDIDKRILKTLQLSGRKKNADLARELGVAPSTMLERIRRLEEGGVVRGYRASLEPSMLGLTIQGFISITLDHHRMEDLQDFEDRIRKIPYVRACYNLTGRFDYLLHVAVRDLEQLSLLIKTQIASLPGVSRSESFLVLSEVKPDGGWPIEDELFIESLENGQAKNQSESLKGGN